MTVAQASADRYSDPTFVGAYLEAEWGDKLQECSLLAKSHLDELCAPCISGFYREVAQFAQELVGETQIDKICDIGCSTGRFLYEFSRLFPPMKDVLGVEPSPIFTDYARKFLLKEKRDELKWIPLPNSPTNPTYIELNGEFFESIEIEEQKRAALNIFTGMGESTPRPENHFDLLFCLNVIDRHPTPKAFIEKLGRLLGKGGFFFLASPMDWDKRFTEPEHWVDDLAQLFNERGWEKKRATDLLYPFRYTIRHKTIYASQVVCMTRI
jgi:SAM-dependent methyltransferase